MLKIKELKCGVRVVMDKVDYIQSAAVGFWFRTGSINETEEYAGISHFIEHMMFKGTNKRNPKQIAEDIDKLGGQINAFTSKELTCYYVKSISEHLFESMDVLVDMLTDSVFSEEEMNRERKVIFEEMKMTEDTPDDIAHDMISEVVNKGNPLERTIIGTRETLNRINRDVLVDYYEKQYTRDSMIVCVVGNFDEDKLCEYLEGKLIKLRAHKEIPEFTAPDMGPGFMCKTKDIEQSHVFLGAKGCNMDDPDYYGTAVLTNILGGNMSSRLFQGVREEKGLAYSVYSVSAAATFTGAMYIYAGVAHENVEQATKAIVCELDKIKNGDIREDELAKAKEQLKSSFIFGLENVLSKMMSIGRSYLLLGKVRSDEEVLAEISKVDMAQVNRLAAKYGDIKNYSGVVVSDREVDMKAILESAR